MPPLTTEMLALLACPVCKQALKRSESEGAKTIQCLGCNRHYPFADGIPVLIGDRAIETIQS